MVYYRNQELPPGSTVATEDSIAVKLPADVKAEVNFAPPPCDPRAGFALRMSETYTRQRGLWPLSWTEEVFSNTDFYALPSPRVYSAEYVASAELLAGRASTIDFSLKSNFTLADCGETKGVEIALPLPEKATNVKCSAAWVDTSGAAKLGERCGVEGQAVRAHGEITAGPKVCSPGPDSLCTCSVLAQGFLQAQGSYQVEEAASEVKTISGTSSIEFPSGGAAETHVSIGDGQKLRHLLVKISRRACPATLDEINLVVSNSPNANTDGVSKTGAFRAAFAAGALRVGVADAFAADVEKVP